MRGKKTVSKYDPQPDFKICTKCGTTKPFDLFSKGKRCPHGRRSTCKKCDSEYVTARNKALLQEQKDIDAMKLTYPRVPDDMKQCKYCFGIKNRDNFTRHSETHDGYSNQCRECFNQKRPSRAGSEYSREMWKKYYAENSDRLKNRHKGCHIRAEKSRQRYQQKRNQILAQHYKYSKLPTSKAKHAARQKFREQKKRSATPEWLTNNQLAEIENIYWMAQDLKLVSGQEYHVDHIVPLQGEEICGLHVPWNLQILPADMNLSKSNKHKER